MTSDAEYQRLRDIAALAIGILIAYSTDQYDDADLLIGGVEPDDLPDALRQLAGLVVIISRESGLSNDKIREQFCEMAARQAADA